MRKKHNQLSVSNSVAQDCVVAGVFEEINNDFLELLRKAEIDPKPLLVCSGGTTTRCAANNHWTLDLRKNYQQIDFDPINNTVEIAAGVSMKNLLEKLSKFKRAFPTGLSGAPGLGYILTGGISPLSRSQGLAIDQILEIKGIWGNGELFNISKPTNSSDKEDHLIWRGLCGAAPFLGIVTGLKLQTKELLPLQVWQGLIKKEHLSQAIKISESWPNSFSLQWVWSGEIKVYVVTTEQTKKTKEVFNQLDKICIKGTKSQETIPEGINNLPSFMPSPIPKTNHKFHSEIIGLLGPAWGTNAFEIIKSLDHLMHKRPNEHCNIASQQLGGVVSQSSIEATSFIHRNSIWKPWVTTSWIAGDQADKKRSLDWLQEVWCQLETHCPGIHLAQMHPHISWHQKEIKAAFKEWLPILQELKSRYDPNGILPQL